MKCICTEKCFMKRPDGVTTIVPVGTVFDFEECPANFESLDVAAEGIDFRTAGPEELLAVEWAFDDLAPIAAEFGCELVRADKASVVAQFTDARERYVDPNIIPDKAE